MKYNKFIFVNVWNVIFSIFQDIRQNCKILQILCTINMIVTNGEYKYLAFDQHKELCLCLTEVYKPSDINILNFILCEQIHGNTGFLKLCNC